MFPCFKQQEVACREATHGSHHFAPDRLGMLIRLIKKLTRTCCTKEQCDEETRRTKRLEAAKQGTISCKLHGNRGTGPCAR